MVGMVINQMGTDLFCTKSNGYRSFLYDENVVLAHFFRKGHMHVAACTWCTWFEHVHAKEGPRDEGEKTDWDFEVGGPSYCENKSK